MSELIMLRLEDQALEALLRKALDGVVKEGILAELLISFLACDLLRLTSLQVARNMLRAHSRSCFLTLR